MEDTDDDDGSDCYRRVTVAGQAGSGDDDDDVRDSGESRGRCTAHKGRGKRRLLLLLDQRERQG
jgi:hypothetical protein